MFEGKIMFSSFWNFAERLCRLVSLKNTGSFAIISFSCKRSINALNCPSGYVIGTDSLCYKVYDTHSSYRDASAKCLSDGGHLASIHNAFANSLVQQLGQNAGTVIWLGLNCPDTNANNCRWVDGMGTPATYNAFYPGNPSGIGECVLMMISGAANGRWVTGDCDSMQIGFACQVDVQS
ncbi:unnamed protein product [Strongylus vulgaris]|uniref:C-type lectin domain-containing protein n=1 Tax=Strongylus vulgaris TaxID=40348 RepID=A0A3P7J4Z9_STRVU|nr:unnamed protein product [Strongylus vulgaris]